MKRLLLLGLIVCAITFVSSNASAGSNGDAPQNGQNWIITQDTHVWDEVVSVRDIIVNSGRTLKLENVSLTSHGFMEIRGETRWINSTIYHEQDTDGDNISLYSKLIIINSDLTLKTMQENSESTANCLDLNAGSTLLITDFDLNPDTTDDRSNIKSDVSGKGNYTEKLDFTVQLGRLYNNAGGTGVPNTKVMIENSNFQYIKAIRFTGSGSYIRNSTFDLVSRINANMDNFIFTNNTFQNGFSGSDIYMADANYALIQDNVFANGSHGIHVKDGNYITIKDNIFRDYEVKHGNQPGVIVISRGSNHTISNNLFENNMIHDMSLQATDDNTISHNDFNVTGVYWHNVMDRAGNRNEYSNNTFINCGSKQPIGDIVV